MNTPAWLKQIKPGPAFSDEMVRAVMDGRKTQTRRMIQDPPTQPFTLTEVRERGIGIEERLPDGGSKISQYAPYQPGEIYYLREGICAKKVTLYNNPITCYTATDDVLFKSMVNNPLAEGDHPAPIYWRNEDGSEREADKLSATCMPRRAARTFLRITNAWVERVQDISYEDVIAEGFPDLVTAGLGVTEHHAQFESAWRDEHGNWESDPLVWVSEFETVSIEEVKGDHELPTAKAGGL